MAGNHFIVPQIPIARVTPVRLGAGNAANQRFNFNDQGKIVKLVGESQYDLCAVGNPIEKFVVGVEVATSNGWSIGGVVGHEMQFVTADGAQADGLGNIAVGDYVVTGTPVALNAAMTGYARVRKATSQTPVYPYAWRVVSLAGNNGAPGTIMVIEKV
jgi:hypothetical protein